MSFLDDIKKLAKAAVTALDTRGKKENVGKTTINGSKSTLKSSGKALNLIYGKVFPIGGIDDNNKYIDSPGGKISTVQLTEPTVSVREFLLTKSDSYEETNQVDKYAYRIPLISINDFIIRQTDLTAFKLDYTGFLPMLTFDFVDIKNSLLSTSIPKDGSIVKVYIGGHGDELYYKPIRQDFLLTNIRKVSSTFGGTHNSQVIKYRIQGKLNVPYGYRRAAASLGRLNARQALFNLSLEVGLGFATNFTKDNDIDKMIWINEQTSTYFDFIENISEHACYTPNTFFTSFIDQYNVLNFVECHTLLSHGGSKTDIPAMIYRCYPPREFPNHEPGTPKETKNQIPLKDGEDPLQNNFQKLSYYFLTNNTMFDGWTNYIEEYHEISNGSSSLTEGFKTHVIYTDTNNWIFLNDKTYDFTIRPIDNLRRDSSTQKIESLPANPTKDTYIPLNLMQIASKDYLKDVTSVVEDMSNIESITNFGNIDTTNMFHQYYFAEVQNRYQMKCLKKCGLKVKLQNYNPAVTKFSRIWVDIYDRNTESKSELVKAEFDDDKESESKLYKDYKERKNANILTFEDEQVEKDMYGNYNRELSGWYVVTEIEINYTPEGNNLNMNLMLNRIEYRPAYKDTYELAKKGVDKYKEENIIEDLIREK